MEAILGGLATYPGPPTVLGNVAAQRRAGAREVQGRGRGRTHEPGATRALSQEPERMANPRPRDQGHSASVLLRVR